MAEPAPPKPLAAHAEGLRWSWREGGRVTEVLRGVSVSVAPGELVAVLGPSGSGKSSLLNLMGLLEAPEAGTLQLAGVPAWPATEPERRRLRRDKLAFVFQFYNLLPTLSVVENVELAVEGRPGGRAAARREALGLLERVGMAAFADRLPGQLSGGEQQRVAIARALVRRPALVLADEPTGNLDSGNAERVVALLEELVAEAQVAVLVATHDPAVASRASRRVHLLDGQVDRVD